MILFWGNILDNSLAQEKPCLYVVATPIGNLGDITYRAIKTLKNVDFILAEDTRHTSKLLNYYEIKKPITSYHSHSSKSKSLKLLDRIESGESAALVSDAGTPCISDPGVLIVKEALERGIKVVPIPGVSAMTALACVSGVSVAPMLYVGFLSNKSATRKNQLTALYENEKKLIVFYESVHRIKAFLEDVHSIFDKSSSVVVGREITKQFEDIRHLNVENILDFFESNNIMLKGEFTIMVDNRNKKFKVSSCNSEIRDK